MTTSAIPYIGFSGTAADAMKFYHKVFGGDLQLMTFQEAGQAEWVTYPDNIMHAELRTDAGWQVYAADSEDEPGAGKSDPVLSIAISADADELDDLSKRFEVLSQGGTVRMPLEQQSWGAIYGQLTDQFGVTWQFNIGND